jgi:hypothetical protein
LLSSVSAEGDLQTFSQRKTNFRSSFRLTDEERRAPLNLFNESTRPGVIKDLYDEAGQTPATVLVPREIGTDADRLLCTPVLASSATAALARSGANANNNVLSDDEDEDGRESRALLEIETLKVCLFIGESHFHI